MDAILRLRKTNRKVDADEVSNRFQRAMEYRKQRGATKKGEKRGQGDDRAEDASDASTP